MYTYILVAVIAVLLIIYGLKDRAGNRLTPIPSSQECPSSGESMATNHRMANGIYADASVGPSNPVTEQNILNTVGDRAFATVNKLDVRVNPTLLTRADDLMDRYEYKAAGNGCEVKPDYMVEDETNFAKKQLLNLLKTVNKKPISLKSPCSYKSYTHATMDDLMRRTMDEISKLVTQFLNKNGNFNFEKTSYGDIQVWSDAKGNKEFKYELFVTSLKYYFQLKLYVNVVKFVSKKDMRPYSIQTSPYIFPTYHNGYPCKDQLIPAPHDVIPTANVVLSHESMKPATVEKAEYMYLNQIDVENSTLVINANIHRPKEFIMDVGENGGVIDNRLEFSHLSPPSQKLAKNPIQPLARVANQWIKDPSEPNYVGQFPCETPPDMWDEDGIYYYSKARAGQLKNTLERDYAGCEGTRTSTEPMPLRPDFWLSNYAESGTAINCGPNAWLFSNYEGPMGTFFGGGKR